MDINLVAQLQVHRDLLVRLLAAHAGSLDVLADMHQALIGDFSTTLLPHAATETGLKLEAALHSEADALYGCAAKLVPDAASPGASGF